MHETVELPFAYTELKTAVCSWCFSKKPWTSLCSSVYAITAYVVLSVSVHVSVSVSVSVCVSDYVTVSVSVSLRLCLSVSLSLCLSVSLSLCLSLSLSLSLSHTHTHTHNHSLSLSLSGDAYYYNRETRKTSWDHPPSWTSESEEEHVSHHRPQSQRSGCGEGGYVQGALRSTPKGSEGGGKRMATAGAVLWGGGHKAGGAGGLWHVKSGGCDSRLSHTLYIYVCV
jgi:hypothetical protein